MIICSLVRCFVGCLLGGLVTLFSFICLLFVVVCFVCVVFLTILLLFWFGLLVILCGYFDLLFWFDYFVLSVLSGLVVLLVLLFGFAYLLLFGFDW